MVIVCGKPVGALRSGSRFTPNNVHLHPGLCRSRSSRSPYHVKVPVRFVLGFCSADYLPFDRICLDRKASAQSIRCSSHLYDTGSLFGWEVSIFTYRQFWNQSSFFWRVCTTALLPMF